MKTLTNAMDFFKGNMVSKREALKVFYTSIVPAFYPAEMVPFFLEQIELMSDHEINLEWQGFTDGTLQNVIQLFSGAGSENSRNEFAVFLQEVREDFGRQLSERELTKLHRDIKVKLHSLCNEVIVNQAIYLELERD